eukprot:CAMPEP_0116140124 /NCGR_PEP_ID=MMETSP0329-20121206/13673_1 /TAXON_ID=697910 /ORGANISM="Pseudo-nitzschia arenysensis, Strain B593" /LENGTH=305 /DNA_ID=CAMNT_0003635203 /DNA_START=150 /DNA_END=1067 /DNA_ORIENTATION=-
MIHCSLQTNFLLIVAIALVLATATVCESFVQTPLALRSSSSSNNNNNLLLSSLSSPLGASLDDLKPAFPENPNIVAAGGWHNVETMAATTNDPKSALVDFIVSGGGGGSSNAATANTKTTNPVRITEKFEALALLLYSMGKGFTADAIDGEWDMVFAQTGKSAKFLMKHDKDKKDDKKDDDKNFLLKIVGKSKNIFDVTPMQFYEETSVFKWFLFGKFVKYLPTYQAFSKGLDGKIVVRRMVLNVVNAFFKIWKLPGIPLKRPKSTGFLDIIYLDQDIRVTKGSKGGCYVHFRPEYLKQVTAGMA